MKAIVATLMRLYEIEPLGPIPVPDYEAMVVGPKGPVMVRFRKRQNPH